ncbi:MAG: hypothetical protein MJZ41_14875 [Bacteroidaceae bacterium]|nr:hypothetical protein [Bacteroidaceae bacterium]
MNKIRLIIIVVSLIAIVVCYYVWFSPLFMLVGVILFVSSIVNCIISFRKGSVGEDSGIGCLTAFVIVALLLISIILGQDCYISSFGDERHHYEDCEKLGGEKTHELKKMSALLWGCFYECPNCDQRKKKEKEDRIKEKAEKKKKENLEFIDKQIDELKKVRERILNGDKVDVSDYEFSYLVEDEIREEAENDRYESFDGY